MVDMVALGDINIDVLAHFSHYPAGRNDRFAETISLHVGGSVANTAIALAGLGLSARLIGRVGQDPLGDMALHELRCAGVQLSGVQRDPAVTSGLIYVIVTPDGERTMLSHRGANVRTDPAQVREEYVKDARLLHVSGYAWLAEPQRSAVQRALEIARHQLLPVSLDPGSALPAETLERVRYALPQVDLLLPSLAEAQALTGRTAPADCARTLLEMGVHAVALKLGRDGCLVACGRLLCQMPAFPVQTRDTTGAGDSFNAGVIAGFLRGLDLPASGMVGNALGALRTSGEAVAASTALTLLQQMVPPSRGEEPSAVISRAIAFLEDVIHSPRQHSGG